MTFKILTTNDNRVLPRSNVRPSDNSTSINLLSEPIIVLKVVRSLQDDDTVFKDPPSLVNEDNYTTPSYRLPVVDPSDLVGRFFLRTEEDRKRL